MSNNKLPQYDFSLLLFKQRPQLIRLAKDHLGLAKLESDVIDWEVVATTDMNIPVVYRIHYKLRSIVGIQADLKPIYGNHHVAEMSLQRPYPLAPCKVYMQTNVWHPNIKWEGNLRGRVCSNVDKLGMMFDLHALVLWVAEILQYKNYHAKNEPPYPEDINVAKWVLEYAEPNGIVDKEKEIFVDDTPLLAGLVPSTREGSGQWAVGSRQSAVVPAVEKVETAAMPLPVVEIPTPPPPVVEIPAPVILPPPPEEEVEIPTPSPPVVEIPAPVVQPPVMAAAEVVPSVPKEEPKEINAGRLKITFLQKQKPSENKGGGMKITPRSRA